LDPRAKIGSVRLRVSDPDAALGFYGDVLGLRVLRREGDEIALSADAERELVVLEGSDGPPPPATAPGLFHTAFRYPTRALLADALGRVARARLRLTGASDHGATEALYLRDPDGNGVELYWDRAPEVWPRRPDGNADLYTAALDVEDLLRAMPEGGPGEGPADPGTDIGHVHLKVSDLDRAIGFYEGELGLRLTGRLGDLMGFLAAGDYHHHVGVNTLESRGGAPAPPGSLGLAGFTMVGTGMDAKLTDPDGVDVELYA